MYRLHIASAKPTTDTNTTTSITHYGPFPIPHNSFQIPAFFAPAVHPKLFSVPSLVSRSGPAEGVIFKRERSFLSNSVPYPPASILASTTWHPSFYTHDQKDAHFIDKIICRVPSPVIKKLNKSAPTCFNAFTIPTQSTPAFYTIANYIRNNSTVTSSALSSDANSNANKPSLRSRWSLLLFTSTLRHVTATHPRLRTESGRHRIIRPLSQILLHLEHPSTPPQISPHHTGEQEWHLLLNHIPPRLLQSVSRSHTLPLLSDVGINTPSPITCSAYMDGKFKSSLTTILRFTPNQ